MKQTASEECYGMILEAIAQKKWPVPFNLQEPWFPGQGERCIEVPWAFSRYNGQKKILEIGLCLADLSLIQAQIRLKELTGCQFFGLDIVDINRVLNRFETLPQDIRSIYQFKQADARQSGFPDNSFDLVFLISTLEHFGFDQFESLKEADTVFKRTQDRPKSFPVYEQCREDRKAVAEIRRILMPGGSLLLTVPMGGRGICLLQDSKGLWAFYKEYTPQEWQGLLNDSGMRIIEQRFFRDAGDQGWVEEKDPAELVKHSGSLTDLVRGVACVELKKV